VLSTRPCGGSGSRSTSAPDVELALRTLREVARAYRGDAPDEIVVAEGPPAPEIVARLVRAGVAVHEARRSRTNLEDLFARLTEES